MKKIILILFFIPMLLQAQEASDWLTPFADARFENGKIIYSFCNSQELMITGIIPKYYSQSLMKLRTDFNRPSPAPADVAKQQEKIRKYLVETSLTELKQTDREEYLHLAAMVLIWDLKLDEKVLSAVENVKRSQNTDTRNHAALILQLEEVYKSLR